MVRNRVLVCVPSSPTTTHGDFSGDEYHIGGPRKFFVVGNWKCNGTTEEVKKIVSTLNAAEVPSKEIVEVVVSPPYVFLPLVKDQLRPEFHVAAQNCWVKKGGAFTGEVSAEMLANLGIPWVILGHSERRQLLNESNEVSCAVVL